MITYSTASKKAITQAVNKAKSIKPMVKVISFGKYQVCGSNGDCYTVSFNKVQGEFTADCTCKAGKAGKVCYHTVACSSLFKQAVSERATACYSTSCNRCDGSGFEFNGQWLCIQCPKPTLPTGATAIYTPDMAAKDRSDLFG